MPLCRMLAGNLFGLLPSELFLKRVGSAKGAAASIVQLLDREVEIDADSPEGKVVEVVEGHIAFKK